MKLSLDHLQKTQTLVL